MKTITSTTTKRKSRSGKVHEMADYGVGTLCGQQLSEPWEWTDEQINCKHCLRLLRQTGRT